MFPDAIDCVIDHRLYHNHPSNPIQQLVCLYLMTFPNSKNYHGYAAVPRPLTFNRGMETYLKYHLSLISLGCYLENNIMLYLLYDTNRISGVG